MADWKDIGIADLERQIAELRAELDLSRGSVNNLLKLNKQATDQLVAAEAENARLRALPLKDEVERVLEQAKVVLQGEAAGRTWYEQTAEAMEDVDALISRLRAGEQEGWRELPLPDPTSHASTSPGPVNCSIRKRYQGEIYPRTCERCRLGPCPFFHNDGEAKRLPAALAEGERP